MGLGMNKESIRLNLSYFLSFFDESIRRRAVLGTDINGNSILFLLDGNKTSTGAFVLDSRGQVISLNNP